MIKLSDIIEYKDVRLGNLTISVGDKKKKYRAIWKEELPYVRKIFKNFPSGRFSVKYKKFQSTNENPWVIFTNKFCAPVYPLGDTTFDKMMPYIYVQHKDGTEVSEREWLKVTSILNSSDNPTICIDSPIVKVDKELMEKPNSYDLKDW